MSDSMPCLHTQQSCNTGGASPRWRLPTRTQAGRRRRPRRRGPRSRRRRSRARARPRRPAAGKPRARHRTGGAGPGRGHTAAWRSAADPAPATGRPRRPPIGSCWGRPPGCQRQGACRLSPLRGSSRRPRGPARRAFARPCASCGARAGPRLRPRAALALPRPPAPLPCERQARWPGQARRRRARAQTPSAAPGPAPATPRHRPALLPAPPLQGGVSPHPGGHARRLTRLLSPAPRLGRPPARAPLQRPRGCAPRAPGTRAPRPRQLRWQPLRARGAHPGLSSP